MKRLLVTTALERTWGTEQGILFLGEWCKPYSRKEVWGARSHATLPYHGEDRDKFAKDHIYLTALHERVLKASTELLNNYHKTNFPVTYWRIIIGPWLSVFVPTLWERWESLRLAFELYDIDETFVSPFVSKDFVKLDYRESNNLLKTHEWNYQILADMIQFQYSESCQLTELPIDVPPLSISTGAPSLSLGNKLQRFIDKLFAKIQRNYKVVFISSYFDIKSLFKLSLKLGQLPRRFFAFDDEVFQEIEQIGSRAELLPLDSQNDFEHYLSKNLFKNFPYSYVEGFPVLRQKSIEQNVNGRIVFTSNAHFSNDFFKVWCADQNLQHDSKLFVSIHGGAIPSSMSAFARHEDIVAEKKIVWHKPVNDRQVRLPPNKFLNGRRVVSRESNDITIIGLDLGLYSYGHQSGPNSSLLIKDIEQKMHFIERLGSSEKEDVKIYPYPHPGWDTKERFVDAFGKGIVSSLKGFNDVLDNSKIIVCTYPQTTFSEAMHSGVPTILLYVHEYWELNSAFDQLLSVMKDAKIVFSDPVDAAQHLSDIAKAPELWWESPAVLSARNEFQEYCLRVPENPLLEWEQFFKKELAK